jgi:tetratricopeptide (TPR) repeat protein
VTGEKSISRVEAETLRAEADAIIVRYLSDNPPTESEWRKASDHYVKVAGAWAEEKNQWLSRARFCLAQVALERNDQDGAAAHLEEAVRLHPRHEETHFALAETYVKLACYELAARQFEILIRDLGQDEFDAHIGLAIASEHLGRGVQAEQEYRRAIQLSPEQPTGYYYLGLFYYGAKRSADAIQQYDEALKRNPKNRAEVYYSRGLAHQLHGSVQPAIEDYQHATVLNAAWLEPRRALAQVFESSAVRRYQDAIAVYQTIIELNREDPFAHWRLGYCYEQSGDAPAAIRAYERALELDPEGAAGFKPDTLRQHIQELGERLKSSQATRLSAWFLTFNLLHRDPIPSGHALERVVLDFRPDLRLKVSDHDLKIVAWTDGAVVGRLKVSDHDLKIVACERLFGQALKTNSQPKGGGGVS